MSIQKIGQKAILQYYKILCRIQHFNRVLNIFEHIHNASQVLLCLPEEKAGYEAVSAYFDRLEKIFPSARISILVQENIGTDKIPEAFQVLPYNSSTFNIWGLPKTLIENVKRESYEVVIDTSRSFSFVNTVAAFESQANLRICFNHPQREDLYNFIIGLDPKQSWKKSMQLLFRFLGLE
ncbi:hypothetical protein JW935_02775 [candidate division KSB1 bacterium]|nr:hypothetical protein [candidate division KSB1 bacterium]